MIDPTKVTEYEQRTNRLEEFILFWVCAAGKNGRTAARCLDTLLNTIAKPGKGPMECLCGYDGSLGTLPELMKFCGIGCYNAKARTFKELATLTTTGNLDLRTCTVDELESVYGIGMKTSRCFVMHSRKNAQVAGIDTHLLKHLRAKGVKDVPKSTPGSKKQYLRLEKEILRLAKEANMTPADYDLMVWNEYSVKSTPRS